jgi:photosystem II stability/assembly factor-like uncharacterized protein
MKRSGYLLPMLMLMLMIFLIISCSKKNDNTIPSERKKYAWICGDKDSTGYGMIFYSADSGETWVRQGEGSEVLKGVDVYDIWAVDENNVWAVCSGNVVLKTSDGGQSWKRAQTPSNPSLPRLSAISIVNKTSIWISGSAGTVINSPDGGVSWKLLDTIFFQRAMLQGVWAINTQKIYVVGRRKNLDPRGFICFTLNGGETWDSLVPENDYNKNEWIGVTSYANTIVIYGGKAHYMVSTNGGITWKNDSVPGTGGTSGADINHLIMLNSQTWWGAFDMNLIALTTDGGVTWSHQPTDQGGQYFIGIDAWDSKLALAVGMAVNWPNKGPVLKFSSGSESWTTKKAYRSNLSKVTFIKQ